MLFIVAAWDRLEQFADVRSPSLRHFEKRRDEKFQEGNLSHLAAHLGGQALAPRACPRDSSFRF